MSHLGWKVPKKSVEIGKISCIMMRNMVAHRHDNKKTDEHPRFCCCRFSLSLFFSTPFKKFKCPVTEITRVFPLLLPFAFYSLAISVSIHLVLSSLLIPSRMLLPLNVSSDKTLSFPSALPISDFDVSTN